MEFRRLKASEIDCRISTINEKGLSLLLYKDARVDQRILDEAVGAENWQRNHEVINGNLFCNVGIWSEKHGAWVWKQDVGVESNTEKEKGEASDSFKRACFNWGIGRELYTAPFIWVSAGQCQIIQGRNGKAACYDRFRVAEIGYDDEGNINRLRIVNTRGNVTVFSLPKEEAAQAVQQAVRQTAQAVSNNPQTMPQEQAQALWSKLTAANVDIQKLCQQYRVRSISFLTPAQVQQIEKQLEAYWNDRANRNPEQPDSGISYGESGFAEGVPA